MAIKLREVTGHMPEAADAKMWSWIRRFPYICTRTVWGRIMILLYAYMNLDCNMVTTREYLWIINSQDDESLHGRFFRGCWRLVWFTMYCTCRPPSLSGSVSSTSPCILFSFPCLLPRWPLYTWAPLALHQRITHTRSIISCSLSWSYFEENCY